MSLSPAQQSSACAPTILASSTPLRVLFSSHDGLDVIDDLNCHQRHGQRRSCRVEKSVLKQSDAEILAWLAKDVEEYLNEDGVSELGLDIVNLISLNGGDVAAEICWARSAASSVRYFSIVEGEGSSWERGPRPLRISRCFNFNPSQP